MHSAVERTLGGGGKVPVVARSSMLLCCNSKAHIIYCHLPLPLTHPPAHPPTHPLTHSPTHPAVILHD